MPIIAFYIQRNVYFCVEYVTIKALVSFMRYKDIVCYLIPVAMAASCTYGNRGNVQLPAEDTIDMPLLAEDMLVSNEEIEAEGAFDKRGDELFDDFLYSYIHDSVLQIQRTAFPLKEYLADGTERNIEACEWQEDFGFMESDYTTAIYRDEQEKGISEDSMLARAFVERIDLAGRNIVSYDFVKADNMWKLSAIRRQDFKDSDLSDFLMFYSRFSQDQEFQYESLASSIRISMLMPDDEQPLEGFVTREQWSTQNGGVPEGVLCNIRYGQKFHRPGQILLEKVGLGNGMSEVFHFKKNGNRWKLVGYDN